MIKNAHNKLTINHNEDGVFGVFYMSQPENGKSGWRSRFFSIRRMIELTQKAPVRYVFLENLRSHLDVFCWQDDRGKPITPNMVLEDPESFPHHAKKIKDAELCYPILISFDKKVIYDGMHRLAKAFSQENFYFIKSITVPHYTLVSSEINISFTF